MNYDVYLFNNLLKNIKFFKSCKQICNFYKILSSQLISKPRKSYRSALTAPATFALCKISAIYGLSRLFF